MFATQILLFTWVLYEYTEGRLHQVWSLVQPVQTAPPDFLRMSKEKACGVAALQRPYLPPLKPRRQKRVVWLFCPKKHKPKLLWDLPASEHSMRSLTGSRCSEVGLWSLGGWVQPVLPEAQRKQVMPQMALQQTSLHLKKQHSPDLIVKPGQQPL